MWRLILFVFLTPASLLAATFGAAAQQPTVTAVSPNSGTPTTFSPGGGLSRNEVSITGTNFVGNTISVRFGSILSGSLQIVNATTIIAGIPDGGTGTVDVTVTTPNGTSATSAADRFTFIAPVPAITNVLQPSSGAVTGGTSVAIIGINFTGVTAVKFGTTAAASFTVNSATSITAVSPAGTGTVDVTVTAPGGTSATSTNDQFTYGTPVPTVTSVSPNSGTPTTFSGGSLTRNTVTITGTNFVGNAISVRFGSTPSGFVQINSATSITAGIPDGGTGTVDVTVTTPNGTSATSAADRFTFIAPVPAITKLLQPTSGAVAGGTSVAITGVNFTGVTAVKFGTTAAASFTVNSATSITAVSPAGTGTVDVTVTAPGGTSVTSTNDQFTYGTPVPTVTSVSPNSGTPTTFSGGSLTRNEVTITGTNFVGSIGTVGNAISVKFGSTPSGSLQIVNATTIIAGIPDGTGTVDVTVITANGTSATSAADLFTYTVPVPAITKVLQPSSGDTAGGTSVAITGINFTGVTAVKFGTTAAASFTVNSATSITAISPAGTDTVDVTVTAPGGTSVISSLDQFTYSIPTTTAVASAPNPSAAGQSVSLTATVSTSSGSPTGNVTFKEGATVLGTATLAGGTAALSTAALAAGVHNITATFAGDSKFAASTSPTIAQTVSQAATSTTITSSLNPSEVGKSVTFTATVSSGSGTPTGTVAFKDGPDLLGTATLSSGIATFTTSSLTLGSHTITANYAGIATFAASVSATLIQAVNTPADSLKLRAMQVLVTPVVGQMSGQAVSGAVDSAIGEAFSDNGPLVMPSGSGVRFNFSGDPDPQLADGAPRINDPFSSATGSFGSGRGFGSQPLSRTDGVSRADDALGALAYARTTKAPPLRAVESKDWFGWAEVRGATLDHWGSSAAAPAATMLYGNQVNLLAGLTRKFTPNFLIGVLGGYETFDYRSDVLLGRLKGDGWTVGSYVGWKITPGIRFDAAVAYSGIGYDGTAGAAAGSFAGNRWLVTGGVTGNYQTYGVRIEPSARVYALWEHESAYTDTLGTLQTARDFATGRASGGVKLSYPLAWTATTALAPYFGIYGDYYFNSDSAGAPAVAAVPFIVLDGWSARAVGGLAATFGNGAQIAVGGERSGIGGNFALWTYRARASLPFGAQ
jgi:hypothetical protein